MDCGSRIVPLNRGRGVWCPRFSVSRIAEHAKGGTPDARFMGRGNRRQRVRSLSAPVQVRDWMVLPLPPEKGRGEGDRALGFKRITEVQTELG